MNTILVVDDDDDIRRVLRRLLEQAAHRVVEADSAATAMALITEGTPPNAIVSDVLMPGKTGLAFYQDLVEVAPELSRRVIFLTGAARDRGVHDRIEALGVPLLAKLDDLQMVVDAVRIALLRR
jgi:DNA-binding NtrC family response regulator